MNFSADSIEVIFRPDPSLYDGRDANVGWLQELPKPITNLSWDNQPRYLELDSHPSTSSKSPT